MRLHFHVGRIQESCALVEKFHYSGRPPVNIQAVGSWHIDGGLFGDAGEVIAACFFSIPPTRWSESVLELSRLVRDEIHRPQLTGLISATVKFLSRKRLTDLVISFADASKGHHGGVYQAGSWFYAGQRDRAMDGILMNGQFIGGRACNHKWGTRSPDKLRALLPHHSIEPHYDEGKHLYWRPLTSAGNNKAKRLGLKKLPYPKPNATQAQAA